MKHYLEIKYEEKNKAKKIARDNGTMINWDAGKKRWYWEGNGDLPECLEKFTYRTTKEAYAERNRSFNSFLKSDSGKRWTKTQKEILADENGYDSYEEMEKEHEAMKAEYAEQNERESEEILRELGIIK